VELPLEPEAPVSPEVLVSPEVQASLEVPLDKEDHQAPASMKLIDREYVYSYKFLVSTT
jgi:hypothetical protein